MGKNNLKLYFRTYTPMDKLQVCEIRRWVYGIPFTSEILQWKYFENCIFQSKIWMAEVQDKIVAIQGIRYLPFQWDGKRITAVHFLDGMVLPSYQRKGIFTEMIQYIMEKEKKYKVYFTFPNEKSLPIFLRLGWIKLFTFTPYLRPVIPILRRTSQPLYEKFRINKKYGIIKDRNFFDWRTKNPEGKYEIIKDKNSIIILALKRVKKIPITFIMEWLGDSMESEKKVLKRALSHSRSFILVSFHNYKDNKIQILNRTGFINFPFVRNIYFCIFTQEELKKEIYDINNWSLSLADNDNL